MTRIRTIASLAATGALFLAPAAAEASHKGESHGKGKAKTHAKSDKSKGKGKAKRCAKTPKVGFNVQGTLVSFTADDPATTDVNEAAVTLTVTERNGHARRSGVDEGESFTVTAAGDPFDLKFDGFEGEDTPSVGDLVNVGGKIARTKKQCAAEGTTEAGRYGTADVRRVSISDQDADL